MLLITSELESAYEISPLQIAAREIIAFTYDVAIELQRSTRELIALYRFYAPRIFGIWVWSVAMFGLAIVWLAHEAYESGRIFRNQYEALKVWVQLHIESVSDAIAFWYGLIASCTNQPLVAQPVSPALRVEPQMDWIEVRLQATIAGYRLQRVALAIRKLIHQVR